MCSYNSDNTPCDGPRDEISTEKYDRVRTLLICEYINECCYYHHYICFFYLLLFGSIIVLMGKRLKCIFHSDSCFLLVLNSQNRASCLFSRCTQALVSSIKYLQYSSPGLITYLHYQQVGAQKYVRLFKN